jgi:hypothetical protein
MTAPKWLTPAGFLGTFTQGASFIATGTNLTLPLQTSVKDATYSIISGELPGGLFLYPNNGIVYGTPFVTDQYVTSQFVIRAQNSSGIADRTFSITVDGPRAPSWVTPPGMLQVGPNLEYYAFNKNLVNTAVVATTVQLPKGETLRYYLSPSSGQLPPGLTLTQDGRITGYVNDLLQLDYLASATGGFDEETYDDYPYDHVVVVKDIVQGRPEAITKIYQFTVVATDGISETTRDFKIQVVDPNSLRADDTYIDVDTTIYGADIGYLIPPIFEDAVGNPLSMPANLGTFRAHNYQVINLNVYDPYPFLGPISYDWDSVLFNPEIVLVSDSAINSAFIPTANLLGATEILVRSASAVPQVGMQFQLYEYVTGADQTLYTISSVTPSGNGYLLGLGVKPIYVENITSLRQLPSTGSNLGDMYIYFNTATGQYEYYVWLGDTWSTPYKGANDNVSVYPTLPYVISGVQLRVTIPDGETFYCGTSSAHPPGLSLDGTSGEIYGVLPYQPAYSKNYRFTVRVTKTNLDAGETVFKDQIFQLTLIGNVDTAIKFISTGTIGSLQPGEQSELQILAEHTNNANININYTVTGGSLPNGLSLSTDGTITGKVPFGNIFTIDVQQDEYGDEPYGFGLFTLDHGATTIDRGYTFEVTANDVYLLGSVSQNFNIQIVENTPQIYTTVYFQPLMPVNNRSYFRSLVQDSSIFPQNFLYRPEDPAFGVQNVVRMYLEYGLQELNLDNYMPAFTNYFKRKRFYFGDVQTAIAVDPNTGNEIYEVVYVNIIDDQMIGSINPSASFVKEEQNAVGPGYTAVNFYPDSTGNMQNALETIPIGSNTISVDNLFRPKFMQTSQDTTGVPLGFVKVAILCYTQPGKGASVVSAITNSGFDFKQLDFDVDRIYFENNLTTQGHDYIVFGGNALSTGFNIVTEDFNPAVDPNPQDALIAGFDIDTEDGTALTI